MKFTPRLWVLAIALAISMVSIINAGSSTKLLLFSLLLGIVFVLTFVKSKPGQALLVIVFVLTAGFLLFNSLSSGVLITSVDANSEAFQQGITEGEIITQINSMPIKSLEDYSNTVENLITPGQDVRVDITTENSDYVLFVNDSLQMTVSEIPLTNLKTGLDISGGARALVKPEQELTDAQLDDLVSVSRQRFNVFGLSDVNIRGVRDLSGERFMLVEVAGATPEDLESLISQQGKFEAKIGNETVFVGGEEDITNVCRNDATCASVTGCFQEAGGYYCTFSFSISLSPGASKRHADITNRVPVDPLSGGQYLQENLSLILDDVTVDELRISSGLKGQAASQISIQGSGQGSTQEAALADAKESMHHLQTVLITGSLPYKLEIVKLDTISPVLGKEFTRGLMLLGLVVFAAVSILIFIKYRNLKMSLAVILTMFSEAVITLGIAALIGWNLDAPGIAGIIAGMGSGVNDQIIIIDESRNKNSGANESRKRAFFIIIGAFLTLVVAMIPLFWAGAGLLKGFALTTIIGVSAGILITRPAFADIIKRIGE